MNPWLYLLWVIVCVALIAALAYWFTKYVAVRGLPALGAARGCGGLQVLARLSLGRDEQLALVQVGERCLLLGVTAAGISTLAELTREEAEGLLAKQGEQPVPPSFTQALRTVIQQRRQR